MGTLYHPRRTNFGQKARGFTLVELVVVLAILVILIGILLPAFGRARDAARRGGCMSNLHQMSLGLVQYALSNERTMPPGNATMTPGYGIDSTWSASHGPHGLAFLITEGYTTDARIYYCPSWTHPYHRYDVVDTTGADPNCGPNGYGGWPAPGNPGPISHRGISYIYRSSFGVDPENPNVAIAGGQPPNLRMPGTQAIVADHFNRRYVLWGQFGHNMGYSTLFLDGHTEWKEDRDSAYMDANAPAFSHGKWGVQEWLWKNFFERP